MVTTFKCKLILSGATATRGNIYFPYLVMVRSPNSVSEDAFRIILCIHG